MDGTLGRTLRRMGYSQARRFLLTFGLVVLFVVALFMYVRGVDRREVAGSLLFVPVFVGFLYWNVRGGMASALLASLTYLYLRYPAIRAVGAERFAGIVLSRSVAYFLFGALGGWANRELAASVGKLELYDQIDDATGLFNARFFLQDVDLELSRSRRYRTLFSVAVVDVPAAVFEPLSRRQRAGVLRDLGRMLRTSVRTVDRAVHGWDHSRHRIAVVLPETGAEGARVFAERLASKVGGHLEQRGAAVRSEQVIRTVVTFPGDEEGLLALRSEFAEIDRAEHPEDAQNRGRARPLGRSEGPGA